MTIIYAIIVLGILVFVHELGHFLVAKAFNVKVEKFSLGFGPKLFSKTWGETEYLVSAFPLGGYVKMFGEGGIIEGSDANHHSTDSKSEQAATETPVVLTEEEKERSYAQKPPLARIAIVMAGPLSNLLFAWLAFIVLSMTGVPTVTTRIGEVIADKPAFKAGIRSGDRITGINGKQVSNWQDISATIVSGKGQPVKLDIRRGDQELKLVITPEPLVTQNVYGEKVDGYIIGIKSAGEVITEYYGPVQALAKGTEQTIKVTELTVMSFVKMVQRVVPLDNVGGPIMIVKMAGEQASAGASSLLAFMALLSVNLCILNLLPVPVLDGGHLVFYLWELVFGRPVSERVRERAQQVGMALLLTLMAFAFYNDIARYFVGKG
ncbi:MAG TPA: RIP metalloprotease RseP [Deltaproteobacteria bacterium]|nr:RIP metalloprotease RseP [Deltaproteobacteria bacterium]HQB38937.1 RIP metalloprotease RseP [Deltaproteobacteria bacterium]